MNIAIIGAGFTGLAAAYKLLLQGHKVTIFEKDSRPGGLAVGFKLPHWDWSLEEHYHHWFANDSDILNLAEEINYPIVTRRPKTSVYVENKSYQLDSLSHVLRFPLLTTQEKLRMAAFLGALRYNPIWQPLEGFTAHEALSQFMGKRAYEMLWKPQLTNKFGKHYQEISLAWFWARVYKRTSNLKYPEGGYLSFAEELVGVLKTKGASIEFDKEVSALSTDKQKVKITIDNTHEVFDAVLVTLPNFVCAKLATDLPESYKTKLMSFQGLGAVNMVLRLKKEFFDNNTYWLSMCDPDSPIMAIVEHTHFMDKSHYNNEHLVYLGNYVGKEDKLFTMEKEQIMKLFHPTLQKLNNNYKKNLLGYEVFRAPFAQPIITKDYSKKILPITTPLKNVYLANMQQVYPWDRGTNYAVALGNRAAHAIMNHESIKA